MTYYTILNLGVPECLECGLAKLPEHEYQQELQNLQGVNMDTCYNYFADRVQKFDIEVDDYYYLVSADRLVVLLACLDHESEPPVIAEVRAKAQHQDKSMSGVWHSDSRDDVHIVREWQQLDIDMVQHFHQIMTPNKFWILGRELVTQALKWKNFRFYRDLMDMSCGQTMPMLLNRHAYYYYQQQEIGEFLTFATQSHKLELIAQTSNLTQDQMYQIISELDWQAIDAKDKIRITQCIIQHHCETVQDLQRLHEAGFHLSQDIFCLDLDYLYNQISSSRRKFMPKSGDPPLIYPEGVMLSLETIKFCQHMGFEPEYFHVCYVLACLNASLIHIVKHLQPEMPQQVVKIALQAICQHMMQQRQLQKAWLAQGMIMEPDMQAIPSQDYLLSELSADDVADALSHLALQTDHTDYMIFSRISNANVNWPAAVAQHLAECEGQAQALKEIWQTGELQSQIRLSTAIVKSGMECLPSKSILRVFTQSGLMLQDRIVLDMKDRYKCRFLSPDATTWAQYLIFVKRCSVRAVRDLADSQGYVLLQAEYSQLVIPTADKMAYGLCGQHDVCFYSAIRSNFHYCMEIFQDLWENDLLTPEVYQRVKQNLA